MEHETVENLNRVFAVINFIIYGLNNYISFIKCSKNKISSWNDVKFHFFLLHFNVIRHEKEKYYFRIL